MEWEMKGPEHVERYHIWMQDPFLLQSTGSEPLSLEEEISHQKSWYEDEMKCTFLVLAQELLDETIEFGSNDFIRRQVHAMVGDVNLFLSEEEECRHEDDFDLNEEGQQQMDCHPYQVELQPQEETHRQAEVDIMIAEESFRGKGLGEEATILMMIYGVTCIYPGTIRRLFVKIHKDNVASRHLFQTKLGFVETEYISVFQQYELELRKESHSELLEYLKSLLLGATTFQELQTFSCAY
jgi:RimJ/RimL family protein N-acetyltransferase